MADRDVARAGKEGVTHGREGAQVLRLAGGGTLGFREYGDPQGSPILFFHGWPSSSVQGICLHGIGRQRRLRVISPDRPGMGSSTRLPGRTFLHLPPLVEELANALGVGRYDVVGVSGGGPYALACAWAAPHRVRAAVVCCGAPPIDSPEARQQFSVIYRAMLAIHDRFPFALKAILAPAVLAARIRPPWPVMRLMTRILGPRDREALTDRARFEQVYPPFYDAMRSGHRAVHEDGSCYAEPWPFDVSEIRVPVRIWHGTQDSNFHCSLAEKLASRIPGSAFHLREEGHYSLPAFHMEEMISDLLDCREPD